MIQFFFRSHFFLYYDRMIARKAQDDAVHRMIGRDPAVGSMVHTGDEIL